jgi:hypothetical protein
VKDPAPGGQRASLRGLRGLELAAIRRGYELADGPKPGRSTRQSTGQPGPIAGTTTRPFRGLVVPARATATRGDG